MAHTPLAHWNAALGTLSLNEAGSLSQHVHVYDPACGLNVSQRVLSPEAITTAIAYRDASGSLTWSCCGVRVHPPKRVKAGPWTTAMAPTYLEGFVLLHIFLALWIQGHSFQCIETVPWRTARPATTMRTKRYIEYWLFFL
jgi:hypothetical protein